MCALQDVEFAPEVRVAARLWLAEVADAAGAARLLACALAQPGLAGLCLDGVLPSDLGPDLVSSLHVSFQGVGIVVFCWPSRSQPGLAELRVDGMLPSNLGPDLVSHAPVNSLLCLHI